MFASSKPHCSLDQKGQYNVQEELQLHDGSQAGREVVSLSAMGRNSLQNGMKSSTRKQQRKDVTGAGLIQLSAGTGEVRRKLIINCSLPLSWSVCCTTYSSFNNAQMIERYPFSFQQTWSTQTLHKFSCLVSLSVSVAYLQRPKRSKMGSLSRTAQGEKLRQEETCRKP